MVLLFGRKGGRSAAGPLIQRRGCTGPSHGLPGLWVRRRLTLRRARLPMSTARPPAGSSVRKNSSCNSGLGGQIPASSGSAPLASVA